MEKHNFEGKLIVSLIERDEKDSFVLEMEIEFQDERFIYDDSDKLYPRFVSKANGFDFVVESALYPALHYKSVVLLGSWYEQENAEISFDTKGGRAAYKQALVTALKDWSLNWDW